MIERAYPFAVLPAAPSDVPAINRLMRANNGPKDALGFVPQTVWFEAIRDRQLWVAVALQPGTVCGFLHGTHHKRDNDSYLGTLCVAAPYRRAGVGRVLTEHFIAECRDLNRRKVLVHCVVGAEANDFWAACGFQHVGVKPGRKRDQNLWELELSYD